MFDNLVESTSSTEKNARTGAFFAATAAVWMLVLVSIVVAGIFMYDAKLNADFDKEGALVAAAPPPPPPPPPPPAASSAPKTVTPTPVAPTFTSVAKPPEKISPPTPKPPSNAGSAFGAAGGSTGGVVGGEIGGQIGGEVGGVLGSPGGGAPPPPPPPPVEAPKVDPPKPPSVTRVSGGVLAGKATNRVQPPYPPMARQANVEGAVVVEVTVSEGGGVIAAHAVSGHPLLRPAAEAAARGWRFSPTLLSGVPVKVIGTITFNFKKA